MNGGPPTSQPPAAPANLPPDRAEERAAMRAFLQRAEARFATMHRIGGSFLGGAGLLVLFPLFFRDAFLNILVSIMGLQATYVLPNIGLYLMLFSTLLLLIYALYVLIKSIVQFYFVANQVTVGAEQKFFPRFVPFGLALPSDEVKPETRKVIDTWQTKESTRGLLIPHENSDQRHLQKLFSSTASSIIPPRMRQQIKLRQDQLNASKTPKREQQDEELQKMRLFYTAFGITGVEEHHLTEEVAIMEAFLARQALQLREVLLCYSRSLLLFLFTALTFSVVDELMQVFGKDSDEVTRILSVGFMVWSFVTPFLIAVPIEWIYRPGGRISNRHTTRNDIQLIGFERVVIFACLIIFMIGSLIATPRLLVGVVNGFATDGTSWLVGLVPAAVLMLYWFWHVFYKGE